MPRYELNIATVTRSPITGEDSRSEHYARVHFTHMNEKEARDRAWLIVDCLRTSESPGRRLANFVRFDFSLTVWEETGMQLSDYK